jgi:hypothetical protein
MYDNVEQHMKNCGKIFAMIHMTSCWQSRNDIFILFFIVECTYRSVIKIYKCVLRFECIVYYLCSLKQIMAKFMFYYPSYFIFSPSTVITTLTTVLSLHSEYWLKERWKSEMMTSHEIMIKKYLFFFTLEISHR